MPNPLEIRLPETGIVESVRVKLENAREKLAHLIVEKEDGERESPIIDVVESIEDCAIDNPDSITSAFFCIYSEYIQETTPKTMNPHIMPILEPNFVHSLNLAFLISISFTERSTSIGKSSAGQSSGTVNIIVTFSPAS